MDHPPSIRIPGRSPHRPVRPVLRGMSREFLGAPGVRPWPVWAGGSSRVSEPGELRWSRARAAASGGPPNASSADRRADQGVDRPAALGARGGRHQRGVRRDAGALHSQRLGRDLRGGGQRRGQAVRRLGGHRVAAVGGDHRAQLVAALHVTVVRRVEGRAQRRRAARPTLVRPARRSTKTAACSAASVCWSASTVDVMVTTPPGSTGCIADAGGHRGQHARQVAVLAGRRPLGEPLGRPPLARHGLGRTSAGGLPASWRVARPGARPAAAGGTRPAMPCRSSRTAGPAVPAARPERPPRCAGRGPAAPRPAASRWTRGRGRTPRARRRRASPRRRRVLRHAARHGAREGSRTRPRPYLRAAWRPVPVGDHARPAGWRRPAHPLSWATTTAQEVAS